MRIAVTLTHKELIEAVRDYLIKSGTPVPADDAIRFYFNGVAVPLSDNLEARTTFYGDHYTNGPYR